MLSVKFLDSSIRFSIRFLCARAKSFYTIYQFIIARATGSVRLRYLFAFAATVVNECSLCLVEVDTTKTDLLTLGYDICTVIFEATLFLG